MCRNIHTLYHIEPPATAEEVRAASLQFVRKISGYTKPSKSNEAAFMLAVSEIEAASAKLLDALTTSAPARDRKNNHREPTIVNQEDRLAEGVQG